MTNMERIQVMSKAELADFLCSYEYCAGCGYNKDGLCCYVKHNPKGHVFEGCVLAAMKYLEAEANG